jgi:hypothetical protein
VQRDGERDEIENKGKIKQINIKKTHNEDIKELIKSGRKSVNLTR